VGVPYRVVRVEPAPNLSSPGAGRTTNEAYAFALCGCLRLVLFAVKKGIRARRFRRALICPLLSRPPVGGLRQELVLNSGSHTAA